MNFDPVSSWCGAGDLSLIKFEKSNQHSTKEKKKYIKRAKKMSPVVWVKNGDRITFWWHFGGTLGGMLGGNFSQTWPGKNGSYILIRNFGK